MHYDTDKVGLRKYFEQYGKILSSEVMYNRETNKSRGFGFVIYADAESVDRALETRMHIIDNKQAEVKRATPRVSSPIKPNVGIVKGNVNGNNYNSSGTNSVPSNTQSNSKASIPVPAAPIQRNMSWANVVSKGPEKKTTAQTTDGGGNNSSNNSMNNNNSQNQKSTNSATSSLSALGTKTGNATTTTSSSTTPTITNNKSNSSQNDDSNSNDNSENNNKNASSNNTNTNDANNGSNNSSSSSSSKAGNDDGNSSKEKGKSVPPGVVVDQQNVDMVQAQAAAAQQMQQQQALLNQQVMQQQAAQNNFVAQQALVARQQQIAINQAMQQMMMNNLGQQGMDGQGQLMGGPGMNAQYQNFNQGMLGSNPQQLMQHQVVAQSNANDNSSGGASKAAPPGVTDLTAEAGKSANDGNASKDKAIEAGAKGNQELVTDADGKPVPSSVLTGTNNNGAFGDNTIPMGMAFQSFGDGSIATKYVTNEYVRTARFPNGWKCELRWLIGTNGNGYEFHEHGWWNDGYEFHEYGCDE